MFSEDSDPNRHLFGAYAVISKQTVQGFGHDLLQDGFWNYLREDITYALTGKCCLKMRVEEGLVQPAHGVDEDFANTISIILAKIVNATFDGSNWTDQLSRKLTAEVDAWKDQLPSHILPYIRTERSSSIFPAIRHFRDCHGRSRNCILFYYANVTLVAAWHYYHVSRTLIASRELETMQMIRDPLPDVSNAIMSSLNDYAMEICGLAFTSNSTSVMVNAYGPIAYCNATTTCAHEFLLIERRRNLATEP